MVTVLYFAHLKEITNKEKEKFRCSNKKISDLIYLIQQKYSQFPNGPFLISVNEQLVPLDYTMQQNDYVAFIPPVSGG